MAVECCRCAVDTLSVDCESLGLGLGLLLMVLMVLMVCCRHVVSGLRVTRVRVRVIVGGADGVGGVL